MRTLVFTDLDGTLLAHDSYSWAGARPVLALLRRRRIPLIFCTSKTRAEVEVLRHRIGNTDPFVAENGGLVIIPAGSSPIAMSAARNQVYAIKLGQPYNQVVLALRKIARQAGVEVRGFHQMSASEVAKATGLSMREAHLSRRRESGEPFLFRTTNARKILAFSRMAHELGYSIQRGGRFWHFSAGCDKGLALGTVISFYRAAWQTEVRTIVLGDSANDLPMLQLADRPILMPGPGGDFAQEVTTEMPDIPRSKEPGPSGWGTAVLQALRRRTPRRPRLPSKKVSRRHSEPSLQYGT